MRRKFFEKYVLEFSERIVVRFFERVSGEKADGFGSG